MFSKFSNLTAIAGVTLLLMLVACQPGDQVLIISDISDDAAQKI